MDKGDTNVGCDPIAIIGIGCRLPNNISSPSELWEFLGQERSAWCKTPKSRFNADGFHGVPGQPAALSALGGYFVSEDIRKFDNQFFGIHNREASAMDPQQRKLLEVVFECFESAGISLDDVSGSNIGCYVASFTTDFFAMQTRDVETLNRFVMLGTGTALLANKISHVFNLKGPSCVIDTACSGSLFALHAACSALLAGECDSAVVAGVNIIQIPECSIAISQAGVLSPRSTCRTFDESADGYGRADGVNAILLKRLDDAVRDGDPIRSVIRSVAVNSNGRTPGIAQPNADGQEAVIKKTYARAGVCPSETFYVESHGTGTSVGDPIELEALSRVFLKEKRSHPTLVGSVKTNLGHSEAASGLTSIIKATLAFEKGEIPATIGVENLNPELKLDERGIEIVTKKIPLPINNNKPCRISINCFGFGGANAHCILEASSLSSGKASISDGPHKTAFTQEKYLLPFSAHNIFSLNGRVESLMSLDLLSIPIADLAYTLTCRRSLLPLRGYIIASQATIASDINITNLCLSPSGDDLKDAKFGFVFTGQGAQWKGMAQQLMQFPSFARTIRELDAELASISYSPQWSLYEVIMDELDRYSINQAEFAQPLTTAVQIGLVNLLRALSIFPVGTIGHSSGEIAAAYAAGILTSGEAIAIAFYRGFSVMKMTSAGAMAAIGLGAEDATAWITKLGIENLVKVACINSPKSVTISGDSCGISALQAALEEQRIFFRQLKTDRKAYHSHHMTEIGLAYEELIRPILRFEKEKTSRNRVSMISTVMCKEVDEEEIRRPSYWRNNLESPVRFSEGLSRLSETTKIMTYVEVGPHATLKAPVTQTLGHNTQYLSTQIRDKDSAITFLTFLGDLYTRGYQVDFTALNMEKGNHNVNKVLYDLPNYMWHYETPLWVEPRVSREARFRRYPRHELLGTEVPGGNKTTLGWRNLLQLEHVPWIRDHKLGDTVVFPAAAYMAMAIEAMLQTLPPDSAQDEKAVVLRQIDILKALPLNDEECCELYTELRPAALSNLKNSKDWWTFQISTISDDVATVHCRGSVRFEPKEFQPYLRMPLRKCVVGQQSTRLWYGAFENAGIVFGPEFQHLDKIYTSEPKGMLYAEARTKSLRPSAQGAQKDPRYFQHPILIDAALQVGLIARAGGLINSTLPKVPIKIGEARFKLPMEGNYGYVRTSAEAIGVSTDRASSVLLDGEERVVAQLHDVLMTTYADGRDTKEVRYPIYRLNWKPDIDHIHTDMELTQTLDREVSLIEPASLNPNSYLLSAMNIITHKKPNCRILSLLSDHELVTSIFSEVLSAQSLFRSFDSFSIGRVTRNNDLEVAEIQNFNTPLRLESLIYRGVSNTKYQMVILPKEATAINIIREYIDPDTIVLRSVGDQIECDVTVEGFAVITSVGNKSRNVQLLKPLRNASPISYSSIVHICASMPCPTDVQLKDKLNLMLDTPVKQIPLKDLTELSISPNTLVISTAELRESVLVAPDNLEFVGIKNILCRAKRIVWVTGSGPQRDFNPNLSIFIGLSRSIKIEHPSTKIFTLELDSSTDSSVIAQDIVAILGQENQPITDYEYMKDKNVLMVGRAVPDELMNRVFRERMDSVPIPTTLEDSGTVQLTMQKPGQLASLQFEKIPQHNVADVPDGSVVVKVGFAGVNGKNVYALGDRVHVPLASCNFEYAGEIVAVGSDVEELLPGDKVAVVYPCPFSNYTTVPYWCCVKLGDDDDMRQMVSTIVALITVLYAFEHRAKLVAGESVLIHSAAGAVGMAAIQMAQLIGADIYATVGTEEKKDYLISHFGLTSDHIFNSHETSFSSSIKVATNGRGVDVVLNSLVGELLHESWECLADFGRFVEIGKRDISDAGCLNMYQFSRSTTFTAFDIQMLIESTSSAYHHLHQSLLKRGVELIQSGQINPISPLAIFPISDISSAFHYFSKPDRMGKVIISFEDQSQIIPVIPEKFTTKLDPQKSYLLVGCLGGLGRSISKWMRSRGARYFVFIGRTGTAKPAAKKLVDDLELAGAHVVVIKGDVCNYKDVERAVAATPVPLGGVVQAAMGLDVGMFNTMTKDSWVGGIDAKVKGTWNLHNALSNLEKEQNLDFFILVSSVSGETGTAGESNYSAANHFLDVFARYRRSLGLVAVSLGLGMISEVGFLHEHPEVEEQLLRKGIRPLNEDELLQIFDYGISQPPTSAHHGDLLSHPHIITGLELSGIKSHHKQGYSGYWQVLDGARFSLLTYSLKRSSKTEAIQTWNSYSSAISEAIASKDETALFSTVCELIVKKLSFLMLIPMENLHTGMPLSHFGMDSMLAAELRQYILSATSADIPFLVLMGEKISVQSLVKMVIQKMQQG